MIARFINLDEARTIVSISPDADDILKKMGIKTRNLSHTEQINLNFHKKEMQRFLNMCRTDFPLKAVFGNGWMIFGGVIDAPKGQICQHFHLYRKDENGSFFDIGRLLGNPVPPTKENDKHTRSMVDIGMKLISAKASDEAPYKILRDMMNGKTQWEGEIGVKGNTSDWGPI